MLVRDSGFLNRHSKNEDLEKWNYHNYRNGNIDNYVLAAEELTSRGYYVFRMGINVLKPLKSSNPKIIDYANSNLRSDFMDIYLAAKCSFCISSVTYGFNDLACLFAKPIVMSSIPIGELDTFSERIFLLSKHHILKKEKRKLRVFNEVLQKCHQRIVTIVKKTGDFCCFFIVPTCIFGVPLYNTVSCVLYLVEQLIKNGFDVKYTHPNLLYISWINRKNRQINNNLMSNNNLLTYDKQQVKNKNVIFT